MIAQIPRMSSAMCTCSRQQGVRNGHTSSIKQWLKILTQRYLPIKFDDGQPFSEKAWHMYNFMCMFSLQKVIGPTST